MSLRIRWTTTPVTGGGVAYLNFYFDDLPAAAQVCADATKTFLTALAGIWPTSVTFACDSTALAFDPVTGNGLQQVNVTETPVVGTSPTANGPGQIQALVSLNTGLYVGGRQIQGRLNLPACSTSQFNAASGYLTTASQAQITGAAQALVNNANTAWAVWSRKAGVTQAIVSAAASPLMATLRSRSVRG